MRFHLGWKSRDIEKNEQQRSNREKRVCVCARQAKQNVPLDSDWQLPRTRDRLYHNVRLLYTAFFELGLCTGEQGIDDGIVPARVNNANAKVAAIVELRGRAFV